MLVRRFAMAACGFVLAGAPMLACVLLPACVTGAHAEQETGQRQKLDWQSWSPENFARAKAEGRFVILDLEAVWCHWCHVMESTTYQDPKVVELLKSKFITVRVDQDANPDLSNRYGDWGWPATIVFAADGSEIAKRRGYLAPEQMASLLAAIIADPTPGPSVGAHNEIAPAEHAFLSPELRATLAKRSVESYDQASGGWGSVHKFIDADSMDWDMALAERGGETAAGRVRQTLSAALNLLDREAGGLFQYSDKSDWKSPHYEKIMWYQANGLRQYSYAWSKWKDPAYLEAADGIARYLQTVLRSPEGAFYVSQDADVDQSMLGKAYYALSLSEREKLDRAPRIDRNLYARENGWAISGLLAYYAATGDRAALKSAEKAARWILENRALDGGGFRHGERDRAGPFLGDTLAMGQAALDLYAATGGREWLEVARKAGAFIRVAFQDAEGGFKTTAQPEASVGVFAKPAKPLDEQIAVTRFANRLHRYFGSEAFRALAEHGGRYLVGVAGVDRPLPLPGVLLADAELSREPTHITIVGRKDDTRSQSLHAAGRAFAAVDKRLDWWDTREGPLPNPDVQYPELDEPAAFACTNRICSLPVFEPPMLSDTVIRMIAAGREGQ
jgi:uncharacterized protein YyaL (SSP411 family)